jgi:hypothetical protein
VDETVQPRLGNIAKFIEWHSRLKELDDEFSNTLTSEEWYITPQARRARNLLVTLDKIASANGATRPVATADGGVTFGDPNPAFDWRHGKIDYAPAEGRWDEDDLRGEALIAELVEVTGIAE